MIINLELWIIFNNKRFFLLLLLFETGSQYAAQTGLEIMILLPPHPKCWDYMHAPPHSGQLNSLRYHKNYYNLKYNISKNNKL
jgi:hypothetical protein